MMNVRTNGTHARAWWSLLLLPALLWALPAAATICEDAGCDDESEVDCLADGDDYLYLDYDGDGDFSVAGCCCESYGGASQLTPGGDCLDDDEFTFIDAAEAELPGSCTTDADEDGWGDDHAPPEAVDGTDCADDDADTYPGAAPNDSLSDCMTDVDGDDWGDDSAPGGIVDGTDCNDLDGSTHPGALEICDGADNDCVDGLPADEEDDDGDGYMGCEGDCDDGEALRNPGYLDDIACDGLDNDCDGATPDEPNVDGDPVGFCDGDCDDNDADRYPGNPEVTCNGIDDDCDGGTPDGPDVDGDGVGECDGDCDDNDALRFPGNTEILCNGIDDDCSGGTPDDTNVDGDPVTHCDGDCDDNDPLRYPGNAEVCDGEDDNDCSGDVDGDEHDDDLDGYSECENDCDDNDDDRFPGNPEACDEKDNNCDGVVPADEVDGDGDNYLICENDCNDADAAVNPDAVEDACDGIDNDCDGAQHPDDTDNDLDSYTECAGDCDDTNANINPGVGEEACDEVDNNCDGVQHPEDQDNDGDGITECDGDCNDANAAVFPGVPEVACDYLDNDCDGDLDPEEVDNDGDGFDECQGDADDTDPNVNPGASEIACNDIDDNGDGVQHPSDVDDDGDGFDECGDDEIEGTEDDDCDDSDINTFPGAAPLDDIDLCMTDADGDDFGDDSVYYPIEPGTDCDDSSASIYYGATEIACDHLDSNCDGALDAQEIDDDGDGYDECELDCNDGDASINPGATELGDCFYVDEDCDGVLHPDEVDDDGDGYDECEGDADDTDPNINPDESEIACNGIDDDGDGLQHPYDEDDDGDGFTECGVDNILGTEDDDCNDTVGGGELIFPGAVEDCSTPYDDDCDGEINEAGATGCTNYYLDEDDDGYGVTGDFQCLCIALDPYDATLDQDCNDSEASVNPGLIQEIACDGYSDNDCDGVLDTDETDDDLDGYTECDGDCDDADDSVHPGATEVDCDGIDNDCLNGDQGGSDGDGDTFTTCGGDCDDASAATYPGAAFTESGTYCMRDADGDGWGDMTATGDVIAGTDCDDADEYTYPGAAFSDSKISCMTDQDLDGYGDSAAEGDVVPGSDCDDSVLTGADVHPGVPEVCEATSQVDNDCDGNVNTYMGQYCVIDWDDMVFPTFDTSACTDPGVDLTFGTADDVTWDNATFYYWDNDGDTYGDDGTSCDGTNNPAEYRVWLCDQSVEGDLVSAISGDCDDTDAGVNPDATESCDEKDNNCNCLVDETLPDEDPSNCRELHLDADRDEWGDPDESICLCLGGDAQAEQCENGSPNSSVTHFYEGECYVENEGDCNDSDYLIHPYYTPPEDGPQYKLIVELLDGADNDCDGDIPVVELDCDDDGYITNLPGFPFNAEIVYTYLSEPETSFLLDGAELWPCWGYDADDPEDLSEVDWVGDGYQLTCWEQVIDIECDEELGLWMLTTAVAEDLFVDAKRYPAPVGIDDCDDNCVERYPGNYEICDGIDNDCTSTEFDDNYPTEGVPGLPDAMESDLDHYGTVSSSEMDLDGDSFIGCSDTPTGKQEYLSALSCADAIPDMGDCNDLCSVTTPSAEEVCNGFLDVCDDVGEGTDLDRDGHRACGAFSGDEELAEYIYVLAHIDPDAAIDEDRASVIPLIMPRRGAPECDDRLTRQLAFLLGDEVADEITLTQSLEPALQHCITAHMCEEGLLAEEDCEGVIEGAGCTVLRLKIGEDQDGNFEDLAVSESCESNPDQLITRTVWHHDRIIDARELVAWWECYRVYGTYGCADLREPEDWWMMEETIVPGGRTWDNQSEFAEVVATGKKGWHELSRYDPEAIEAVMTGCWEEDIAGALAQLRPPSDPVAYDYTGGDCVNEIGDANRGESEGPDDLLGQFFNEAPDCRTCIDGVDNNCNGLTDCEDPACAECFIGQGVGCAASGSPCSETGCSTSGDSNEVKTSGAILAFLWLAAMTRIWRRVR